MILRRLLAPSIAAGVISALACATLIAAAAAAAAGPENAPATRPAAAAGLKFHAGRLPKSIGESSGLVASRRHAGVFWTLNDSGNPPALFAIERDGTLIREYPVASKNVDWEDLAIDDDGHLYIADTGNNDRRRTEVRILQVDEPDPHAPLQGDTPKLRVRANWRLKYPEGKPFDCEAVFVLAGRAYLLPKKLDGSRAEIFRVDLAGAAAEGDRANRPLTPERIAGLPAVRAPVTAADVSPDGKRLAVLTVFGPYVFEINGDVAGAGTANATHSRYIHPNAEAACFTDGGLLVTTEKRDVLFFRDDQFKPATN
jgi:hypothetical protein